MVSEERHQFSVSEAWRLHPEEGRISHSARVWVSVGSVNINLNNTKFD